MVTLAGIGAAAQGIGSIASAFGLGGDDGPGPIEQMNYQLNYLKQATKLQNNEAIQQRVAAAKATGLHPLSVMGISPSGGGSFSYSSPDNSVDLGQLGQGIDRALNAGRTTVQKKLDDLALEKAQLSNDYLKVQIAGAQKAITETSASPRISDSSDTIHRDFGSTSNRVRHVASESVSHKLGDKSIQAGENPMWQKHWLNNDDYIMLPPGQTIEDLGFPMSGVKSSELAYKMSKNPLKKLYQDYKWAFMQMHKNSPYYKWRHSKPKKTYKKTRYKMYKYGDKY